MSAVGNIWALFCPPHPEPSRQFLNWTALVIVFLSLCWSASGGFSLFDTLEGVAIFFALFGAAIGIVCSIFAGYGPPLGLPRFAALVFVVVSVSLSAALNFRLARGDAQSTEQSWYSAVQGYKQARASVDDSNALRAWETATGDLDRAQSALDDVDEQKRKLTTCTSIGQPCQAAYEVQVWLGGVRADSLAGAETSSAVEARRVEAVTELNRARAARDAANEAMEAFRSREASNEQRELTESARRDLRPDTMTSMMVDWFGLGAGEPDDVTSPEYEVWIKETVKRGQWCSFWLLVIAAALLDFLQVLLGFYRSYEYVNLRGSASPAGPIIDHDPAQLPPGGSGGAFVHPDASPLTPTGHHPGQVFEADMGDDLVAIRQEAQARVVREHNAEMAILRAAQARKEASDEAKQQAKMLRRRREALRETLIEGGQIDPRDLPMQASGEALQDDKVVAHPTHPRAPSGRRAEVIQNVHVGHQPAPYEVLPPILGNGPLTDEERAALLHAAHNQAAPQLSQCQRWVVAPSGEVLDRTSKNARYHPIWQAYWNHQRAKASAETVLKIDGGEGGV